MTSQRSSDALIRALGNILGMEDANGYEDRAVAGGLDGFLATLRAQASDHPAIKKLERDGMLAADYADLSLDQRKRWCEEVGRVIAVVRPSKPAVAKPPAAPKLRAAPKPRVARQAPEPTPTPPVSADSQTDALKSVTRSTAEKLKAVGVHTVRDLVLRFPTRHLDYSALRSIADVVVGEEQTIVGALWEAKETRMGRGGRMRATEAVVGDSTGNIRVIWFNQPWVATNLRRAQASLAAAGAERVQVSLSGKVTVFNGRKQMDSPEWEAVDDPEISELVNTGRMLPVYPKTEGLYQKTVRKAVREALDAITVDGVLALDDPMPTGVAEKLDLVPLARAVSQAHYPDSPEAFEEARRRLAFDELFVLQLAVATKRARLTYENPGIVLPAMPDIVRAFIASLPFELTAGQRGAIADAMTDVSSGERPMSRLLQGDVGSGKTVVAVAMLLAAVAAGHQGAIMAPTEVLAEQHFLSVRRLLGGEDQAVLEQDWFATQVDGRSEPIAVGLLTGSTRAPARRELLRMIGEGTLHILIGTHALIQSDAEMPNLALAVVDEQHRFGVLQRAAIRSKGGSNAASGEQSERGEQRPPGGQMTMEGLGAVGGELAEADPALGDRSPHLLLMSATPIPRTLALTIYGDLETSVMPELPSGRREIKTTIRPQSRSEEVERFLVAEAQKGRQSFVVCPLIDESEAVLARAATAEYERLRTTTLSTLRVALLHGRMSLAEKQAVMHEFRAGDIDVLVTTPVIEVGIDVPNATVMMIEGADRFGLAQLHQLRGRVGRGEHQSYCILLSETQSGEAEKRMDVLAKTNDGFVIAEADLQLRGPGDFFGTRQSGLPTPKMARPDDRDLLSDARDEARPLLREDPTLANHPALAEVVSRFTSAVSDEDA